MNMFSVVLGGVITIITAIFVENMRRPRLKLKILAPLDITYQNRPAHYTRYLLVGIENKNLPCFVKWMSRNAALQCHGTISFHHLVDGQNIFGRMMDIRWSSAPEPIPTQIVFNGHQLAVFDHHRFQTSQRIDI